MNYLPENDGIDHINIYSKGQTKLGRFLSNFSYEPFKCEDGKFNSIEGYWYWLGCKHKDREKLRYLYGYMAKKIGRELGCPDWLDTDVFRNKIKDAMKIKIENSSDFYSEFKTSKLPFTHYYTYGSKVIDVPEANWILEYWEELRK